MAKYDIKVAIVYVCFYLIDISVIGRYISSKTNIEEGIQDAPWCQ